MRFAFDGWPADSCQTPLELTRSDVLVTAVKRADRGPGIVVRLTRYGPPGPIGLRALNAPIRAAWRVDARERDRADLPFGQGWVRIFLEHALTSVRLVF